MKNIQRDFVSLGKIPQKRKLMNVGRKRGEEICIKFLILIWNNSQKEHEIHDGAIARSEIESYQP